MMGLIFDCWKDTQQEQPVAYCCVCGGEIYAGDLKERIDSGYRHAECRDLEEYDGRDYTEDRRF